MEPGGDTSPGMLGRGPPPRAGHLVSPWRGPSIRGRARLHRGRECADAAAPRADDLHRIASAADSVDSRHDSATRGRLGTLGP